MVFPRLDDMITSLNVLQPKPDQVDKKLYDLLIKTAINKIISDVVAFTHVPANELPDELDTAILLKLSGWITDAGLFMAPEKRHSGAVTGVTEGDTSVSYGNPQTVIKDLSNISFVDDDFKVILINYRRIRGWTYE